MKITIDTERKTIELQEDVHISKLEELVRTHNLQDYTISFSNTKPFTGFSIRKEFLKDATNVRKFIEDFKNIGPGAYEYGMNLPVGRKFVYPNEGSEGESNESTKQLLKG